MIREGGATPESRLIHGFRVLLSRHPKPPELATLWAALNRSKNEFNADPEAAKQFLKVGETSADSALDPAELAAFTTVASTLLNLDETVTKP
jgi:hypothetical protein